MPYWFLGQRQSKGFAGSFTRDDGSAVFSTRRPARFLRASFVIDLKYEELLGCAFLCLRWVDQLEAVDVEVISGYTCRDRVPGARH